MATRCSPGRAFAGSARWLGVVLAAGAAVGLVACGSGVASAPQGPPAATEDRPAQATTQVSPTPDSANADHESPTTAPEPRGLALTESGPRWEAWTAPELKSEDAPIVLVRWNNQDQNAFAGEVRLLSADGARILASVSTSHGAMAVWRKSAGQLLISDLNPADRESTARLLILDARNGLKLVGETSLPDRLNYNIFSQGLILSADEGTLYYRGMFIEREPGCVGDGGKCAEYSLRAIPLQSPGASPSIAPLGKQCPFGSADVGPDSVIIACLRGEAYEVRPGSAVQVAGYGEQVTQAHGARRDLPGTATAVFAAGPDRFVALLRTGDVAVADSAGARLTGRAIPLNRQVFDIGASRLRGGDVVAIPYRIEFAQAADGLALLDLRTLRVSDVPGGRGTTYFVRRAPGETIVQRYSQIVVLADDGKPEKVLASGYWWQRWALVQ